jgi:hypothetical protein
MRLRGAFVALVAVASLVCAAPAQARTLYAGPARGVAQRFALGLAALINRDRTTPLVATKAGVTGCRRLSRLSWSCRDYIYVHDAANPQLGTLRCEIQLRVSLPAVAGRPRVAGTPSRPVCHQA